MSKSLLSFVKVEFFEVGGGINESTNQKSSSCNPQFKVQTKLWKTKMIKKAPRGYLRVRHDSRRFGASANQRAPFRKNVNFKSQIQEK